MCMMVYLASDLPLRTIPWDKVAPGFTTSALASGDKDLEKCLRRQFTKPHLLYVGSYEGCGCGFQLGQYPSESSDPADLALGRRSLCDFATFLRDELPRAGTIELFACWDGDQGAPPEHRRTLTPSSLEGDSFFFLEKELSTIEPDAG